MKHVTYYPVGTCSKQIDIDIDDDGRVQNVSFMGGCNGNLQGISSLVRGQKIDDIINKLQGIRCGMKRTSCPDQLCEALKELKNTPLAE